MDWLYYLQLTHKSLVYNNETCCIIIGSMGLLWWLRESVVKNLHAMQERGVQSLSWEDPLEKEMAPTPVFLPGEV